LTKLSGRELERRKQQRILRDEQPFVGTKLQNNKTKQRPLSLFDITTFQYKPDNKIHKKSKAIASSSELNSSIKLQQSDNILTNSTSSIDVVEVFADVTKWLEYNVLMAEFGESLMWNSGERIGRATSGALLGFVAAVSTQLYADVLYGYFKYGPEWRRKEVSERKNVDWVASYSLRAVSSAALFGVYEFTQKPVSRYIQGMLAGGVDGCLGSKDFDACLQTYIDTNAPGASPEAQFRALTTNLLMVIQRIQDVAGDTSQADFEALFRAWTVSFISYVHANLQPDVLFPWFTNN